MTVRTQVTLPTELIQQIDSLVGKKGRSTFIAEAAIKAMQYRSCEMLSLEDSEDIAVARKNLKARTRIPWSAVKRKRKSG